MNPSLIAASALFAPFGRFLRNLHGRSEPNQRLVQQIGRQPALSIVSRQSPIRRAGMQSTAKTGAHRQRQPLRVVRVMEAGQTSALAGRILMSGRMADVCAELDRMVEREAAFQSAV